MDSKTLPLSPELYPQSCYIFSNSYHFMWLYILKVNLKSTKPHQKELLWPQRHYVLKNKGSKHESFFWHLFSDILRSTKRKLGNKVITRILISCFLISFQRLNLMIYGARAFFSHILSEFCMCVVGGQKNEPNVSCDPNLLWFCVTVIQQP